MLAGLKDETVRKEVEERIAPLLDTSKVEAWATSPARKAWTDLSHRPRPDPKARARILAEVACKDDTGGYIIKGIARRVSGIVERWLDYAKLTADKLSDPETCPAAKHLDEEMLAELREIAGPSETTDEGQAKAGE